MFTLPSEHYFNHDNTIVVASWLIEKKVKLTWSIQYNLLIISNNAQHNEFYRIVAHEVHQRLPPVFVGGGQVTKRAKVVPPPF